MNYDKFASGEANLNKAVKILREAFYSLKQK